MVRSWKVAAAHIRFASALSFAAITLAAAGCGSSSDPAPAATQTPLATATRTVNAEPTPSAVPTFTATPVPVAITATATIAASPTATATPRTAFVFAHPLDQQLSLAGPIAVDLLLPANADSSQLLVTLDGAAITDILTTANGESTGTVANVGAGPHRLVAVVPVGTQMRRTDVFFETEALQNPDVCEVLNNAECLLPYPSSRFLEPAETPTGWRVNFPAAGMPKQNGHPVPAAPYQVLDGFSPTVQILMHFPGGVDPVQSNASRLLAATRTYDLSSLAADSPTILIDADTGERILHFIEVDVHATTPDRQTVFMRPGLSLTPGHHYIVAMRHLVHPDGSSVEPEPPFAVLRDNRPTDIAAINARRSQFEDIFARLAAAGIARNDLVLAFDFYVQSDQGLTGQMLSMRDQAFAWLAQQAAAGTQTFSVTKVTENDCTQPGVSAWRIIEGTYQVPLFLTADPVAKPAQPGLLNVDANGVPVSNGFTNPPFTVAIPCAALANGGTVKSPIILGHGLFGDGRGFVYDLTTAPELSSFDYIAGATDWSGLSSPDIGLDNLLNGFIGHVILDLRNFPALPDRLRQGQLNTLVLGKMMHTGIFNAAPAFQTPSGVGVLAGPNVEEFYFGASLGGIMGLMYSALSPDIINSHVDVPAINFSILLQRATPFLEFQSALQLTGITDPMQTVLLLGLMHELWVRGESAGYATHITSNPLEGTNVKNVLMTAALYDPEVSNQGTEIAARTLGLPSLIGSILPNRPLIPDEAGPLPSALVFYNTGDFDSNNAADVPFIPPLANLQPQLNHCNPHGEQAFIPAAIQQMLTFLKPAGQVINSGQVVNYCNGLCDAGDPTELPHGNPPCNPLR